MLMNLIYNLWDEEMQYLMKWSWVQYHFYELCKLYIGRTIIQHVPYYILLSIQITFTNDLMSHWESLDDDRMNS